jgi:hypothetical protein
LYAASANALVIAAPPTVHVSTRAPAGPESYQRRSWCRAEQFCFAARHGANGMWLATSADHAPEPVTRKFLETSLMVFEGDMTCCAMKHMINGLEQRCDRHALLLPILGLCACTTCACPPARAPRRARSRASTTTPCRGC